MAVDIRTLAVHLRVSTDPALPVNEPHNTILSALLAWAEIEVSTRAPDAPDAQRELAIVQLCGYVWDRPPSTRGNAYANAWSNSMAAQILRPWTVRRAIPISGVASDALAPGGATAGSEVEANRVRSVVEAMFSLVPQFVYDEHRNKFSVVFPVRTLDQLRAAVSAMFAEVAQVSYDSDTGMFSIAFPASLPLAGGTLTGALTLAGAPTKNLEAATKKYVDDSAAASGVGPNIRNELDTLDAKTQDLYSAAAPADYQDVVTPATQGGVSQSVRTSGYDLATAVSATDWQASADVSGEQRIVYLAIRAPANIDQQAYRVAVVTDDPKQGRSYDINLSVRTALGVDRGWRYWSFAVPSWAGLLEVERATNAESVGASHFTGRLDPERIAQAAPSIKVSADEVAQLDRLTADIRPGSHPSGTANVSSATVAGLALRTSAVWDLAAARLASSWVTSYATKPTDTRVYPLIRLAASANPSQYQFKYTFFDGSVTVVNISSWNRLGSSADNAYDYYTRRDSIRLDHNISNLQLLQHNATDHVGTSRFIGNLDQPKVLGALGLQAAAAANRGKLIKRRADDSGFEYAPTPSAGGDIVRAGAMEFNTKYADTGITVETNVVTVIVYLIQRSALEKMAIAFDELVQPPVRSVGDAVTNGNGGRIYKDGNTYLMGSVSSGKKLLLGTTIGSLYGYPKVFGYRS